jgi:hypothetical protein
MIETDFSAYQPGVSYSKAALVGFASKGTLNEPQEVRSLADLTRLYGQPNPSADHGSYLLYAAIEFLKYGNTAWILRVGVNDESDWDNLAKTAYVEVPASGTAPVIRTLLAGSTSVAIAANVNDKFRFSANGTLYKRTIQIPAGTYTLVDMGSGSNLVDTFNGLFSEDDGIEAFEYGATGSTPGTLAFRTTNRYGSTASLELISTEDAIYPTIKIGSLMNYATLTGGNTNWPLGSSVAGFSFSGYSNPTLSIRVSGTGDNTVDNVEQTIPFSDLTTTYSAGISINNAGMGGPVASANEIAALINWFIDNPSLHTYTVPGGFRAKVVNDKVCLYTAKRYSSLVAGLTTPNTNVTAYPQLNDDNINFISGSDALVQVKFDSVGVDDILGFSTDAVFGSETTLTCDAAFLAGGSVLVGGVTYRIDCVGQTNGASYAAGSAPILMTIWADSPGLTGNLTQVQVGIESNGNIDLAVYNNSTYVEGFAGLNLENTLTNNPYYIEQYVNGLSDYIYVDHETAVIGAPAPGTYQLGATTSMQGSDGYPYTLQGYPDTTKIDALIGGNAQLGTGLFAISEPEKIDIDLVAAPGLNSTATIANLINLCEVMRRDCMAVIDSPAGLSSIDVAKWHNGSHPLNTMKLNSSFAALYWPWVKMRDPFNQIDVWVPPTGSVLGVYAKSEQLANAWAAPAGLRRGTIPTIEDVETYAYLAQRDSLYGNGNAVNCIVNFPVEGPTVWGQKTLYRASTALNRVNVRRLALYLEKIIRSDTRPLIFEPHDAILEQNFVRIANGVLTQVQMNRGIYAFSVLCDSSLNTPDVVDRNELRAQIGIQPTKTAEFIYIEMTLFRTGSFEESEI